MRWSIIMKWLIPPIAHLAWNGALYFGAPLVFAFAYGNGAPLYIGGVVGWALAVVLVRGAWMVRQIRIDDLAHKERFEREHKAHESLSGEGRGETTMDQELQQVDDDERRMLGLVDAEDRSELREWIRGVYDASRFGIRHRYAIAAGERALRMLQRDDDVDPRIAHLPSDAWIREVATDLRREERAILAALDEGRVGEARRLIRDHFEEDFEQAMDVAELSSMTPEDREVEPS